MDFQLKLKIISRAVRAQLRADGHTLCLQLQAEFFSLKSKSFEMASNGGSESQQCVVVCCRLTAFKQRQLRRGRRNIRDLIWRSYLDSGKTDEQAIDYRPSRAGGLMERHTHSHSIAEGWPGWVTERHTHTSGDHYFLDNRIIRRRSTRWTSTFVFKYTVRRQKQSAGKKLYIRSGGASFLRVGRPRGLRHL